MKAVYTVKDIRGDYAILVDSDGAENTVALALLPPAVDVGSTIIWENFQYELG